jgi:hypothetical protein
MKVGALGDFSNRCPLAFQFQQFVMGGWTRLDHLLPQFICIKILADAILGEETGLVSLPRLRPRGWASVFNMLPAIIKDLHYNSDADGFLGMDNAL